MLSSCAFAPLFKISIIKERFLWLLLVIEKDQTSLPQQQQKELLAYSSPLTLPFYIYKASLKFHVSKAKSYHHYPTKHYVQIYIYVHHIIYIMYESVVGFFLCWIFCSVPQSLWVSQFRLFLLQTTSSYNCKSYSFSPPHKITTPSFHQPAYIYVQTYNTMEIERGYPACVCVYVCISVHHIRENQQTKNGGLEVYKNRVGKRGSKMKKKNKNQLIINLHSHSFCFYLNNSKAYQAYMVMFILILFGASYYGKSERNSMHTLFFNNTKQHKKKQK